MPKVVRIGDPLNCGDHVSTGSSDVFVNELPMVRKTDRTTGHCFSPVNLIPTFASTVFCNNRPIALVGLTKIPTHCCGLNCHSGVISDGSADVFAE